jgi:predicted flap endonuclease-1-like 5' DNA nuclease
MSPRTEAKNQTMAKDFPLGWTILGATFLSAALVLFAYRDSVRLPYVVWYQFFSGLLLAVSGGAITGWGIAAFIASSKGTTERGSAYETRPKRQPTPDDISSLGGEPLESPPAGPIEVEALTPDDPLSAVRGIGPKRAREAATLGFQKLGDISAATPESQQKLKASWGRAIFAATFELALAAASRTTGSTR